MVKRLVENYLETGLVDPQLLEAAIKVGTRRGKTPKTDIEKRKKAREYYRKHKAEILKKAKLYRMKNKKRLSAYAKAYRKKFGESSLETWDDILAQLNSLLDVAEEVDSRLALIILQAINEIETGLVSDEELPDYQQLVMDVEEILYGNSEDSTDDMSDDGGEGNETNY